MPITVLPIPAGTVGPGLVLRVTSDFEGPIPLDAVFVLSIGTDPEGVNPLIHVTVPSNGARTVQTRVYMPVDTEQFIERPLDQPADGDTVHVVSELVTVSGILDSGAETSTWDGRSGIGGQIYAQAQGHGLTSEQATQLENAERRSQVLGEPVDLVLQTASGLITSTLAQLFSRQTLDRLTLFEVTSGPTCEPVRATVGTWATAAIVRVTTIAEDLVPKTPDGEWYFPDLAVLRIFRGVDLQYRRGIHTPTFMVEQPWQWSWQFLNELQVLGNPPDITIAVDWRLGCCGQVFLMSLP